MVLRTTTNHERALVVWRRRTAKQLLLDDPEPIPSQAVTQPIDPAIVTTTETPPAAARATSLVRMPLLHRDETNEQQSRRLSIHSEEVFPNADCTMCKIPKRGFSIRFRIPT